MTVESFEVNKQLGTAKVKGILTPRDKKRVAVPQPRAAAANAWIHPSG